ncbi:DgyrCDS8648 [Dimorphilus gyrociliatus]|uniref:DgyrCDS8648 n=1 Tax=Dimorphilus gyrociliatus TaxID=2664684 RepID=A0A7I8VWH0_9ANNE|nr:DgyrCDS8648 [Dimorphilus gyrociliatus]
MLKNLRRRDAQRNTWAQNNFFRNYPSLLLFFVGVGNVPARQKAIEVESRKYGDIIQIGFIDNYKNLTYKATGIHKWIATYCSSAKYVVKSDDDMFINPFYMLQLMKLHMNKKRTIICYLYSRSPIIRMGDETCKENLRKWCIPKHFLPEMNIYPTYCSGSAFIYTADLSLDIYSTTKHVNYFYIDDVYMTGLILKFIRNITKIDLAEADRYLADIVAFSSALRKREGNLFATHAFYLLNQELNIAWYSLLKSMVGQEFDEERQPSSDSTVEINSNNNHQNYSTNQQSTSDVEVKNDEKPRAIWSGHVEFLLSCISFAVGLGNIWRFPHQCYQNGGGAFLIIYILMLIFLGLPLFFLEMAFGQYASLGPITIWRICPLFKEIKDHVTGLGYMMVFISSIVSIYYNVVIGYTLIFLFYSFTSKLPWSYCHPGWINCKAHFSDCPTNTTLINSTQILEYTTQAVTATANLTKNSSTVINCTSPNDRTPSEIFWYENVLDLSDGIHEMGGLKWKLVLFLLLAWVIVFLCIMKGIKSSGKVAYFTGTFPYVILLILFFRGVTLKGAGKGIEFYLKPDFEMMKHSKVWRAAAVQILYSLGPGFGGLLTMSSYNKFNNNCHRDALIVALVNSGTSIFAGFVIFSVLGFMAHETQQEVKDVVKNSGPGLAFIAYPEALAQMKGGPFWSICFFFMLFVLGLGSQFIIIASFIEYDGMKYENYTYPQWAEALGWLIVSAILLCLPVYMIIKVANCVGSLKNLWWVIRGPYAIKVLNLRTLIEPSSKWGPALEKIEKNIHILG